MTWIVSLRDPTSAYNIVVKIAVDGPVSDLKDVDYNIKVRARNALRMPAMTELEFVNCYWSFAPWLWS